MRTGHGDRYGVLAEPTGACSAWVHNNVLDCNAGWGLVARGAVDLENNLVTNHTITGLAAYAGVTVGYDGFWHIGYDSPSDATNISGDPRYTDSASGDYSLDVGRSPCVDAGNPLAGYNDGDGSRDDMGAFGGPAGSW